MRNARNTRRAHHPPHAIRCPLPTISKQQESHRWDSNPRPAVYKTAALPIELQWQVIDTTTLAITPLLRAFAPHRRPFRRQHAWLMLPESGLRVSKRGFGRRFFDRRFDRQFFKSHTLLLCAGGSWSRSFRRQLIESRLLPAAYRVTASRGCALLPQHAGQPR